MADSSQGGRSQGQGEEQAIEEIIMEEVPASGASAQETHILAEASANDAIDAAKTPDRMAEKDGEAEASKEQTPASSARAEADKGKTLEASQAKAKELAVPS